MVCWVKIEDEPNDFKPIFQIILVQEVNDEDVCEKEFHYNGHQ